MAANLLTRALCSTVFFGLALSDIYIHSPGGSNDRCDEKSNNRDNANRLFDSENNAAGGYAVCDSQMFYYEDTVLRIEFMSQHNCGNGALSKTDNNEVPEYVNCQHVIQYSCEENAKQFEGPADIEGMTMQHGVSLGRPGADRRVEIEDNNAEDAYNTFGDTCTETMPEDCVEQIAAGTTNDETCSNLELANSGQRQTFNSDTCKCSKRKLQTYTVNEPNTLYQICKARERNGGLFTADQNVNDNQGATATRQERNSARYGFECVEERDYYPYWHPSIWVDIAILTSNVTACDYYQTESQNVKSKGWCVSSDPAQYLEAAVYNNPIDCEAAGYVWEEVEPWNVPAPDCLMAAYQTDNRLGNVAAIGDTDEEKYAGQMAHYDWTIPTLPKDIESQVCTIRVRYNISTGETPFFADASYNDIITNNPVNNILAQSEDLPADQTLPIRQAINTAQFGRTFQDRTYSFEIRKRPKELRGKTIHNLNVRGKRGNIAQVRNCVEYDFTPIVLKVRPGDYVHFQTCGSDYNNNNNAGEGRAGSDRSNMVIIKANDPSGNRPAIINSEDEGSLFDKESLIALAWLGQKNEDCFSTEEMNNGQKNNQQDPKSCHFLNGVRQYNNPQAIPPLNHEKLPNGYFSIVTEVKSEGVFHYMSSRNNNFTNRSQKGTILSEKGPAISAEAVKAIGITAGVVGGVAILAVVGFVVIKKARFSSRV